MDRITGIEYHGTTGLIQRFTYAYNSAGMITNRTTEGGGQTTVVSYAYNSVDELVRELSVSSVTSLWEYSYDLAGNRTNWIAGGVTNVSTFASGNQMTGWGSGSLIAYDSAGNMTQIVNRAGVTNSLVWNARYQLTEVRTNGAIAESYGYDALGRRAWISDGVTTNYFVYDGLHVIAEAGPSGSLGRSYTWGPGVDNLLSFTDYTGGETNTYYAIKDHIGTVTAITDTNGAIIERYEFDAFGNVLGIYDSANNLINESLISNHYLHQGRWYSWETGYYYHRARWRNPETGTWLSKDPIGISGGLNAYEFCFNNPMNWIDPLGNEPRDPKDLSCSDVLDLLRDYPKIRKLIRDNWTGNIAGERQGTEIGFYITWDEDIGYNVECIPYDPRNTPHCHWRPTAPPPPNTVATGHSHGPGVYGFGPSPGDRTYPNISEFVLEAPGSDMSGIYKFTHPRGGNRVIEETLKYRNYVPPDKRDEK